MASTTVDTLLIKIQGDVKGLKKELDRANKNISDFSGKTTKQTALIRSAFSKLAPIVATVFGIQTIKSITSTVVSFEKLRASLYTVTGSAENADIAFQNIKDFATSTPYQVENITEAFIRLKSLGLDASNESLKSFGNTASAMGKDIIQFIEAIADASTGEFERLKEFGIKARQEGDNVAFTFQGVTTTVKKNADDIQQYLKGIGDVQFAGAMEKQMDTLGGSFSNLGDSASQLAEAIGEAGLSKGLKQATSLMTEFLNASKEIIEGTYLQYESSNELSRELANSTFLREKLQRAMESEGLSRERDIELASKELAESRAMIALLRSEIEDEQNMQAIKEYGLKQRKEELELIDSSLIPKKKNIDYLKQEIEALRLLGLSDAELERRGIREQLKLLSGEYVKSILTTEETARATEHLTDRLEELSVPLEFISQSEIPRKKLLDSEYLNKLADEDIPKIKNELDKFAESAENLQNNLINFAIAGVGTIEDSFVNLINGTKSVKESFKDMANSIINDIIRMTIRQTISAPLAKLASGFIGGMIGGSATGGGYGVSSSLSGQVQQASVLGAGFDQAFNNMMPAFARAGGGSVSPGRSYMVGERGAELFVPSTSGRIVSNSNLKSSGSTITVNQNLNFSTGIQQTVRAEVIGMLPSIKEQTLSAVADAKRRGGAFGKVFA